MFFVENGSIKLSANRVTVCPLEEVERALTELTLIRDSPPMVEYCPLIDERFTAEGIDREFRAEPGFPLSRSEWKRDACNGWKDIEGPALFKRYQKHAELYCEGCVLQNEEPTYEGFRAWLNMVVEMAGHTDLY